MVPASCHGSVHSCSRDDYRILSEFQLNDSVGLGAVAMVGACGVIGDEIFLRFAVRCPACDGGWECAISAAVVACPDTAMRTRSAPVSKPSTAPSLRTCSYLLWRYRHCARRRKAILSRSQRENSALPEIQIHLHLDCC